MSFSHFFLNNPADVEFLHGVLRQEGGESHACTVFAKDDSNQLHSMELTVNPAAQRVHVDDAHPKPFGCIILTDLYGSEARLIPSADGGVFELAFNDRPPTRFVTKLLKGRIGKKPRTHLQLVGTS